MKIKVSWLWLPFACIFLWQGIWKVLFFIFLMLSIHEAAHIAVARYFRYEITEITLYPFGLCARMDHLGFGNVFAELAIILAGPACHLLYPFLFQGLLSMAMISPSFYEYLCMMNMSILVFNLLPIYPLDGGRFMQSLFHLVLRFQTAQYISFLCSIMNMILIYYYRLLDTFSGHVILLFLAFQIIISWKEMGLTTLQFLHYRKCHPTRLRLRYNKKTDFFRANTNLLKVKDGWILEEEWLKHYFHDEQMARPHTLIL